MEGWLDSREASAASSLDLDAPESRFCGTHLLAELFGVDFSMLDDEKLLCDLIREAVPLCGAQVLGVHSHHFAPHGVTAVALLSESHASIHTYPQFGAAFLDIFTCGNHDPDRVLDHIRRRLRAVKVVTSRQRRGGPPLERSGTCVRAEAVESIAPGIHRHWEVQEVIARARSPYQEILIGRTRQGLGLFCNGERQSTELSQLIYHEGQIYPAALIAGSLDSVLVIGSSEGVVSHLACDLGAREVVHVDIDLLCVELCAKHLPYGYTLDEVEQYRKPGGRIELRIEDGAAFVEQCVAQGRTFDVIVLDLPDEEAEEAEAQHNRLYGEAFLRTLSRALTPEGALITQAGCSTYWRNETLKRTWKRFEGVFRTRVMFEMEEQDWVWVVGTSFGCPRPVERMLERLEKLQRRPCFIDAQSIVKATIPPFSVRASA